MRFEKEAQTPSSGLPLVNDSCMASMCGKIRLSEGAESTWKLDHLMKEFKVDHTFILLRAKEASAASAFEQVTLSTVCIAR